MSDLECVAEQVKLERLLDTPPDSLAILANVAPDETRAFREQMAEFFYRRYQDAFRRLAGMSKVLPLGMSAKLAKTLLGPILSAGIACELPVARAVKLADRLPTRFLAKLSLYLDPRRAAPIISAIDEDHIVNVAKALNDMGEYVTLARFVTFISESALKRVIANADEDAVGLLKTGMYIEDKSILDSLLRQLSDAQRHALLDAANDNDLWPEFLSQISYLKPDMQVFMSNLAGELPETVRDKLIRVIYDQDAWESFFIVLSVMNEANLQRSARLPALREQNILRELVDSATRSGKRRQLLPLLGYLDDDQKALIE